MRRGPAPGGALALPREDRAVAPSEGAALDSVVAERRARPWLRAYGVAPRRRPRLARGLCGCLLVPALLRVAGAGCDQLGVRCQ